MLYRPILTLTFSIIPILGATKPRLDWVASLDGNGDDRVTAIAIDSQGNTYLTGSTTSFDLGTPGAFQPRRASSSLYSFSSATLKFSPLFPSTPAPIYHFAADPLHPGTIYAATLIGLMRTTDSGLNWTWLWQDLPSGQRLVDVAVAPSQPNVLYAGLLAGPKLSVYKSSDSGATWKTLAPLPSLSDGFSTGTWSIAVDPFEASHVVIYGSQTSYTTDGGASWTQLTDHVLAIVFDPTDRGTLYGSLFPLDTAQPVLVKSTDNGHTFVKSTLTGVYFSCSCILPSSRQRGVVYAATGNGISQSADAGATWTLVARTQAQGLAEDQITGALYAMTLQDGVFLSNDGFRTSTRITPATAGNAIGIPQTGTLLFATDEKREMFVSKLNARGHVVFTTYVGGLFGSRGTAIAVDGNGQIYATGQSASADFPVTSSLQDVGSSALYLVNLSADGDRIGYSTRISGGASGAIANALVVDLSGNVYFAGTSDSGYPTTPNSAQPTLPPRFAPPSIAHTGAFATKLAPDGRTLIYSTYFGTGLRDQGKALLIDPQGNAYVGGTSLWKLDATGSKVLWTRTMAVNPIQGITRDQTGNIYVCGGTYGGPGFATPSAFQSTPPPYFGPVLDPRFADGNADAFVAKLDSASGNILYATLLGGRLTEAANGIVVDAQGNAIVVGTTDSMDFPSRNPFQAPFSTHTGFLAKLNADGSDLMYSTFLGDARAFDATAIGLGASGDVILAGYTSEVLFAGSVGSTNLRLAPGQAFQPSEGGGVFINRILESHSVEPVHVDAVLNVASLASGPVVPGEWVSVRGSGFGAESSVLLGDQRLPSILVSDSELQALVPDIIQPRIASAISVASQGQVSPSVWVNTAVADPAIFTQAGTGLGQALAFNPDGSQNGPGNPAQKSSTIDIVVNGLGVLDPGVNVALYYSGGIADPAIRMGAASGLRGGRYPILRSTIPADVVSLQSPGIVGVVLIVDGVISSPLFMTTISVK